MCLLAHYQTDMSGHVIWSLLHFGGWTVAVACTAQTRVPVRNPHDRKWTVPGGKLAAVKKTEAVWTVV